MDIDSLLWPTLGQRLVRAVRFCLEVVGWFVVWMVLCFLLLAGALAAWKRGRTRAVPEGSFLRDLIRPPGSRRDEPGAPGDSPLVPSPSPSCLLCPGWLRNQRSRTRCAP